MTLLHTDRVVRSQIPGHDPSHEVLPVLADEWFARYDRGDDVTLWYTKATAATNV